MASSPRASLIIPPVTLLPRQLLPSTSTSLAPRFLIHTSTTTTTTTPHRHPLLRPAFPPPLPPTPTPPPLRLNLRYRKTNYSTRPPSSSTPKPYTFEAVQSLLTPPLSSTPTSAPHQHNRTIIIDVREPSELHSTGRIPGSYNMPLTSNPDAFHLGEGDFFERFGFEKPRSRRAVVGGGGVRGTTRESRREESPFSGGAKEREAGSGLNAEDGEVDDSGVGDGKDGGAGGEEEEEEGVEEVVFYCKAGVRSRAAARMAREWAGIKVGDMTGGWMEWERRGGQVER